MSDNIVYMGTAQDIQTVGSEIAKINGVLPVGNEVTLTGANINATVDGEVDSITDHLNTIKEDLGDLGTQVATIEGKIPDSASTTNQLATASDISGITSKIPSGASSSNKLATASDIANFLDKTSTEEQTLSGNLAIEADLSVMGDAIFETANPICQGTETYGNLDDGALVTKANVESRVSGILPEYPSEDGTYVLKFVLDGGVGSLSWVKEEA
ncbi:MAG: hypothetical protein KBT03_09530 [Bacteroidales bacterium]|nr:hypothetical protein [Candidatus Scybalousia scybalohippi]